MKIRITNLDRSTTDADLRDLFEEFGEVMYAFVTKRSKTGGRTFTGYVEMPEEDEASEAIDALHGEMVDGTTIKVEELDIEEPLSQFRDEGDWEELDDEEESSTWEPIPKRKNWQ